jgi:hypothetical protein
MPLLGDPSAQQGASSLSHRKRQGQRANQETAASKFLRTALLWAVVAVNVEQTVNCGTCLNLNECGDLQEDIFMSVAARSNWLGLLGKVC